MASYDEKNLEIGQVEKVSSDGGSDRANNAAIGEFTPEEQRKIVRKSTLR